MNSRTSLQDMLADLSNQLGQCLTRYDFHGAVEVLQKAHKLDPENDKILVDLGSAYAKSYDFESAEKAFAEALRVSKSKGPTISAIGNCWLDVRQFEQAQKCFEQVLKQNEIPLSGIIRLAEIYIRLRLLNEAVKLLEKAWKIHGPHEAILVTRAKIHREMKQFEAADKLLRVVVNKSEHNEEVRALAWYEISAMHDARREYDDAMTAALNAKALMRLQAANALKILPLKQATMREMAQTIRPAILDKWRKSGKSELQPQRNVALLGGHARSGTTMLEYVLDSHPGIISAEETQTFHNVAYYPLGRANSKTASFVSTLDWLSPRVMRQIRSDYFRGIESYLHEPVGDRLLVDKNPANTFDLLPITRIFPETKFIIALRDPRDVCLSSFMQAVSILPDTSAWLTWEGTINHYALIMGIWLACKPGMNGLSVEVRYEDMVADLEKTSRNLIDFLGLPWDERVLKFHEHASQEVVRSPTFADVTKPLYKSSVGRWRNYQKYFEPHMKTLAPFLKAFGYE